MKSKTTFLQKPIFLVGVALVFVMAFVLTQPDAAKVVSSKSKPMAKKKTSLKSEVVFTKEDELANFKPVNSSAKNSFVPVVARHSGVGSADGLANAIPVDMTGGEANWVYTGTADTDGVRVALIENRSTGDAVFLKRGERWKSAIVLSISEYSVILKGPGGTRTLGLVDEELKTTGSSVAQAGAQGFSPARVDVPQSMRGGIGRNNMPNGFSISPNQDFGQGTLPSFPGNEPE